uniref:small monomeric GTPase n=1 Tax=Melopsittacus undulatus TaxID=13146 RepID=A0A8C6J0C2_MELUD
MRLISQDTMSQYSTNFLLLPIPEYPVLDCVPNKIIKLVVLGGSSVGKTALVVRFLTKRFIGDYEANTGALYSRKFTIDGEQISLQVQDTPFVSLEPEHSVLGGSHAESLRIVATPEMLMLKTETEATRSLVLFSESLLLALYIANDCVFQNSF